MHIKETGLVQNINFLESSATVHSYLVSFTLSPLHKEKSFKIKAFTVKNLITGTPVVDWRRVSGGDMEPVAEVTKLGWAFSGRVRSDQNFTRMDFSIWKTWKSNMFYFH